MVVWGDRVTPWVDRVIFGGLGDSLGEQGDSKGSPSDSIGKWEVCVKTLVIARVDQVRALLALLALL